MVLRLAASIPRRLFASAANGEPPESSGHRVDPDPDLRSPCPRSRCLAREFGPIAAYTDSGLVSIYSVANQALLRSFVLPADVQALSVAGGDVKQLVFVIDGALALVDGTDGSVRTTSDYLGVPAPFVPPPSLYRRDAATWFVGYGSNDALFRLQLELTDRLFAASFEIDG
jgi:hypothetical protein